MAARMAASQRDRPRRVLAAMPGQKRGHRTQALPMARTARHKAEMAGMDGTALDRAAALHRRSPDGSAHRLLRTGRQALTRLRSGTAAGSAPAAASLAVTTAAAPGTAATHPRQ